MTKAIMLTELSPEQFNNLFDGLRKELAEIKANLQPKQPSEYLTRNEVAQLLKVDLSTLWNWQNKGKVIPYTIGNRVYFKRDEIEASLVCIDKKKGGNNE